MPSRRAGLALVVALVVALSSEVAGQEAGAPPAAKGEIVTELDKAIWHVFQAKNGDYWFGSHDRGVYRYDGNTLVNYTTKDGLISDRIATGGFQEDKAGNIYITNGGVSKFDGRVFTTLRVAADAVATDWKLRPDDLWFPGPTDTGTAYRYDGKSLHQLALPTTKEGDDFFAQHPRAKYPNIKYSPYDVYTIFKDGQGNVWFATALLGVCRYDGKSFAWLPEAELRNGSFGTRSIVEDKDGRFWFCKAQRYEVDPRDPARPSIKKADAIRDAGDLNRVAGIMSGVVDGTGALWLATYGNGVWRYDGTTFRHYPVKDGGKEITLFTISKDNRGVLWLGTHSAGAYKFNDKSFEKFRP